MEMRSSKLWLLAFILALTPSLNQRVKAQQPEPKARNWVTVWEWTVAPWNGNDKPYQQMRDTIDNAIAGGRKPQELVEFYELPALEHPNDPIAQFRWAYATYKVAITTNEITGDNMLYQPLKALVLAPFPKTYDYARLIYLMEDYGHGPFILQLRNVSKRLVKHNPNDKAVNTPSQGI